MSHSSPTLVLGSTCFQTTHHIDLAILLHAHEHLIQVTSHAELQFGLPVQEFVDHVETKTEALSGTNCS